MANQSHRTLLLSLDGATWDVLTPLMENGALPTISELVATGLSGPLQSVIPPITTAAWTSFQTGMAPAHHGVFSFHNLADGGRSRTLVDATEPPYASIWDYLNAGDQTSIVVNLPVTFPADRIPAHVISGLLAPSFEHPDATSASSVRSLVEEVAPNYQILRNPSNEFSPHEEPAAFIDSMKQNVRSRAVVTRNLLAEYANWDVCMMHVQSTDVLQHPMWKHCDASHPDHDPDVNELVVEFYKEVDAILGDVISDARETADHLDIILLSDHGFQGLERKAYLDVLLAQNGFLSFSRPSLIKRGIQASLKVGKGIDVFRLRHRLFDRETVSSLGDVARNVPVDWDSTVAWGYGNLYGYVYLHEPSERTRLRRTLESLADPERGDELVREVVDVNEAYDDPHPDAPDFIVVPTPGTSFETLNDPSAQQPVKPVDYGCDFHVGGHAEDGILVMAGEGIPHGATVASARLIDVMPTVLHRQDVGVPIGLDGEVIKMACRDNTDVELIDPLENTITEIRNEPSESVEDRLENLGYME